MAESQPDGHSIWDFLLSLRWGHRWIGIDLSRPANFTWPARMGHLKMFHFVESPFISYCGYGRGDTCASPARSLGQFSSAWASPIPTCCQPEIESVRTSRLSVSLISVFFDLIKLHCHYCWAV